MAQRIADVILNSGAGTLDKQALADSIAASLSRQGVSARLHVVQGGGELDAAASRAVAGDADVIVAGGGDGTIATVSRHLVDSGKALGVLPLGTFNYFAKNLGVPLDLEPALALSRRAVPRR